jgi:hypothetical protein
VVTLALPRILSISAEYLQDVALGMTLPGRLDL